MSDYREAKAFLEALGSGPFVFQTFSDKKPDTPRDPKARVYVGRFEDHVEMLQALNEVGAGVYVQVNAGAARGKGHVTGIRAVFVDLDYPETTVESLRAIMKYMPPPSAMVETSPKKLHVYWRVDDCPLNQFEVMQTKLAQTFGADSSMKNLDRVMRIPSFNHLKRDPFPVSLKKVADVSYTMKTLLEHINRAQVVEVAEVDKPGAMPSSKPVNNAFGIDVRDSYQQSDVWAEGNRTGKMVQHIGSMVANGYGSDAIKAEIRKLNVELCPEGQTPKSDASLELEVFPAIANFIERRHAEQQQLEAPVATAPPPPKVPMPPVQGATPPPAPIPMPSVVPPPPVPDQPETLENWIARYLFVADGSRVIDTHKRGRYGEYTLADFRNKTANIWVPVNNNRRPLHKIWFEHSQRRTVRDTYFRPTDEEIIHAQGHDMWNLYAPTEVHPVDNFDPKKISVFMDHMDYLFPKAHERDVMLDWMAMTIQRPEIRIPWAPLLISSQGVGKGFLYQVISRILGTHNSTIIMSDRLESPFNPYMYGTLLVCIDEMKHGSRFNVSDKLKSYISEPTVEINEKGKAEKTRECYANFIIFTNHDNSTYLEDDDRRFWVYKVPHPKRDPEYYERLFKWLFEEPQALNQLHRWLLDRDISKFRYATCPDMTEAKIQMIDSNKTEVELDALDAIEHRDGIFGADVIGYAQFKDWANRRVEGTFFGKSEGLLRQIWGRISKPLPNCKHGVTPVNDVKADRQRVRCIRNHKYWLAQDTEEVKYEFTRSVMLGVDPTRALPPKLKEIKGDKNEKPNRA